MNEFYHPINCTRKQDYNLSITIIMSHHVIESIVQVGSWLQLVDTTSYSGYFLFNLKAYLLNQ